MELGKIVDIEQIKKNITPREKVVANIQVRGNRFFSLFAKQLKPYGISEVQFNVLKMLNTKHPKPLSAGEISKLLISQASDVTRIIDRMLKKGLVNREVPQENRRMILISLTDEGLKKVEETKNVVNEIVSATNVWSDEEVDTLNKLLDKLE